MLKPILSKDGNLQKLSPHVYHTITDNSRVAAPTVSSSGYYAYFPVYTDKGPTNEVRTFSGSTGFAKMLETYGKPNAKKYGLPYSAAVQHVRLGGSVAIQSIKPKGATHAAVVVVMKVKPAASDAGMRIGWVYTGKSNTYNVLSTTELVFVHNGQPTNIKFSHQFMRDETDLPEAPQFKNFFIAGVDDEAKTAFKSQWKEVRIKPLDITFETVPMSDILNVAKKNSPSTVNGANSWQSLGALINLGIQSKDTYETILNKIETDNNEWEYTFPVVWGMCTGKGKYGNGYIINFANTKSNIQGRPVLKATITDQKSGEIVPESEKSVSFSNDFGPGDTPLLLDAAYSRPYFNGEFKLATAPLEIMDEAGEIIQKYLSKAFNVTESGNIEFRAGEVVTEINEGRPVYRGYNSVTPVKPIFNNGESYGSAGDYTINEMKKQLLLLDESEDSSFHRLSYLDFTRLTDKIGFVKSAGISAYAFNGGHEGELQFMKEFNWDFNFEDPKLIKKYANNPLFKSYKDQYGDRKIVQEMFIDAFSGKFSKEIHSLYGNPADYVIDCGYPADVQTAIAGFAEARDDVQIFLNTDINSIEIGESISYKNKLNFSGRNFAWYPGNFEWVDPYSSRSVRVPQTFAMIPNILAHFENGFDSALAGTRRGLIQGVQPFSGRGFGSTDIDENDKLITEGLNILSAHSGGQLYVDSQLTNYEIGSGTVSSLNEIHNNSIINRIIKHLYKMLQDYKHLISSDATAASIQEAVNRELAVYYNKVAVFDYKCEFKSSYHKAIGLLSHTLSIQFFNTIKYHHIELKAMPIT